MPWSKYVVLICRIKEPLEETKAAEIEVRVHWIPTHRGITGIELAKHRIRHGRDSQITIPVEDMKSLWRKESKEGSQL
jgi:hypothetical protein